MNIVVKLISLIGFVLTLVPAFLVFIGTISLETHKNLMIVGTLCWFLSAPFWMNRKEKTNES